MADLSGEILPENLAADLCDYLVEQVEDSVLQKAAENRLAATMGRIPFDERQIHIPYFALSIFLNSVGGADFDPIAKARDWTGGSDRKWTELFFGTGVLFGSQSQALSDSITNTILGIFGQPRSTPIREILRFFNSRESQ
jgi:hypothetical protein